MYTVHQYTKFTVLECVYRGERKLTWFVIDSIKLKQTTIIQYNIFKTYLWRKCRPGIQENSTFRANRHPSNRETAEPGPDPSILYFPARNQLSNRGKTWPLPSRWCCAAAAPCSWIWSVGLELHIPAAGSPAIKSSSGPAIVLRHWTMLV